MRPIQAILFVLLIPTIVGCQRANFTEAWNGPQATVNKGTSDGHGPSHPVPVAYDADTGTYRRETTVIAPPWSSNPAKTISAIKPFQADALKLPEFRHDGTALRGGGSSFTGGGMESITDAVRRGPILLSLIGGLAVLAGIVLAVWAKRLTLGLAVAAGGAVLITAGVLFETYPWIVLVAAITALALAVWWILDARFAGRARTTLAALVRAVDNVSPTADVKYAIADAAKQAGTTTVVKQTISNAKRKAGIT